MLSTDDDSESSSGGAQLEDFVDRVWSVLRIRLTLYGASPPYTMEGEHIASNISLEQQPAYLACLLFSVFGNPEPSLVGGTIFEKISTEAVKNYLGGDAITTGFPSNMKIEDVANSIGERFNFEPHTIAKDSGVDIVAWKKFNDERPSQCVILVQCAAGGNWKNKTGVPLNAWRRHIAWTAPPQSGFCIPASISDYELFVHYSALGGNIFFDRTRIYRNVINTQNPALATEIANWCRDRISTFEASN